MVAEIVRQEEFEGTQLAVIEHGGEEWFMAEDIGKALGYAGPRSSIIRIFNRNRDEFEGLSREVKVTTRLIDIDFRPHRCIVFNSQACIKFGFFANTPRAKAFGHWASNFLAQGVKRLKEGVARLEAQHLTDQARIQEQQVHIQELEEGVHWVGSGEFAQVVTADAVAGAAQCVIQGYREDIDRLQAKVARLQAHNARTTQSARHLLTCSQEEIENLHQQIDWFKLQIAPPQGKLPGTADMLDCEGGAAPASMADLHQELDQLEDQVQATQSRPPLPTPWTVPLKKRDLYHLRDLLATKDPRYNRMARRIFHDLLNGREPDFFQEFPEPDRHLLNRDNCFDSEVWKLLEEWSGVPALTTGAKARLETAKTEIRYTALTASLSQNFFEMVLKALRNYEGNLQEMPLAMQSLI